MNFMENFEIRAPKLIKNKYLEFDEEGRIVLDNDKFIIKKDQYRVKASYMEFLSLLLFYDNEFFKPMLIPQKFETILDNCDALGIEMPEIPRTKDYKSYLEYYYDICSVWDEFQKENAERINNLVKCFCFAIPERFIFHDKITGN